MSSALRAAAEQSLEALENVRRFDKENLYGLDDDITVLRAALAELANLAGKMIASAKVQVEYAALRKDVPEISFLKDDSK